MGGNCQVCLRRVFSTWRFSNTSRQSYLKQHCLTAESKYLVTSPAVNTTRNTATAANHQAKCNVCTGKEQQEKKKKKKSFVWEKANKTERTRIKLSSRWQFSTNESRFSRYQWIASNICYYMNLFFILPRKSQKWGQIEVSKIWM